MASGEKFEKAVSIMERLRAPGGCPWDREQTFDTIKRYTLEETYEVLEAIDNRDWQELPGELGDLLLQVLFYAEMAREEGRFGINDVLDALIHKLISRHPHVFGDVEANTAGQVVQNWEAIKAREKQAKKEKTEAGGTAVRETLLGGVSSKMPALIEAHKISSKAAQVGFDWPEVAGLFQKLTEEAWELMANLRELPPEAFKPGHVDVPAGILRERIEDEVGDLFFVLVNIARYLKVDAESALRRTNRKFRRRFGWLEEQLRQEGKELASATLEDMERLWQKSKESERT